MPHPLRCCVQKHTGSMDVYPSITTQFQALCNFPPRNGYGKQPHGLLTWQYWELSLFHIQRGMYYMLTKHQRRSSEHFLIQETGINIQALKSVEVKLNPEKKHRIISESLCDSANTSSAHLSEVTDNNNDQAYPIKYQINSTQNSKTLHEVIY